jgi:hypothetical protein
MNPKVVLYELIGIVFIVVFGSLLHFTYEWSNSNPVVGAFSAVNESVWEHLKLVFYPTVVFALIEFGLIRRLVANFWLAKTVGVYVMVATIPAIFYVYTAFIGESILAVDISSFVFAVVLGQLVSLKLLTYRRLSGRITWIALIFLIGLGVAFLVFTYMPPNQPIFQDPITGQYGISP